MLTPSAPANKNSPDISAVVEIQLQPKVDPKMVMLLIIGTRTLWIVIDDLSITANGDYRLYRTAAFPNSRAEILPVSQLTASNRSM